LIPSDVGRPVGDLVSKLQYNALVEDAQEVLRTLVFKEAEVMSQDGAWYLMRILPYRTTENVIDGLVVTFVDISKVRVLQDEAARVLAVLKRSPAGIFAQDRELRYQWMAGSLLGRATPDVLGRRDVDLLNPEDARKLGGFKQAVLTHGQSMRGRLRLTVDGKRRLYAVHLAPTTQASGEIVGLSGLLVDAEDGTDEPDVQSPPATSETQSS